MHNYASLGQVTVKGGALVYRGRYDPYVIEAIREVPGRKWEAGKKEWHLPANQESLNALQPFPGIKISTEAYRLVQSHIDATNAVHIAKQVDKPEPIAPMPIKDVEPFAHQIRAYNIALNLDGVGLLHEQGCGKTLTTIAVVGQRFKEGAVRKVLVVAPLSVLPVWESEFADRADFPYELKMLTGGTNGRMQELNGFHDPTEAVQVALINYEGYWREGVFEGIIDWKPDLVVVDESQKIKDPSAKQSKGLHILGDRVPYRMILTGTPVTASPLDFWSQYRFLNPNIFGKSYYSFRNRYAMMGGYQNKQVVAYKNKDDLVRKAHSIAHRVTKNDALDLPEQMLQNKYCCLEPEAHRIYQQMLKTNVAEIEAMTKKGKVDRRLVATNILTRLLRLQQMVGGFVPDEQSEAENPRPLQVSSAKLNLLKETLTDLLTAGKKVVVFVRFISELNAITKMLETEKLVNGDPPGVKYSVIHGAVKQEDRGEMVRVFQNDPECKVFVAQIQTAGLGITLHAADTSIFYSADFNWASYDQCKARLHRIGQKNNVTHIHLITQHTVDEKIYKSLRQKEDIAVDVVDNWQKYFQK